MKPDLHPPSRRLPSRTAAYTLPELLVAVTLFLFVLIGGLYSHIMGLKMSAFTQSKLRATHNARAVLNYTRDEIRQAELFYVGNGDNTGFTNIAANSPQQGNALQIYPTSSTNNYIRYYLDRRDQTLKRKASGTTNTQTIASYITNTIPFRSENYAGTVLTNDQNSRVLRISLDFYQWEFAVLQGGGSDFYDYYHLQTKIARRK